MVHLCLPQVDVGKAHTTLGGTQLTHVGNHLDTGNHLAHLDHVAGLLVHFGDDAADLRFDVHLVSRFNLSGDDGGLVDVLDGGFQLIVGSCLRLRLEIQEHECTCKQQ